MRTTPLKSTDKVTSPPSSTSTIDENCFSSCYLHVIQDFASEAFSYNIKIK